MTVVFDATVVEMASRTRQADVRPSREVVMMVSAAWSSLRRAWTCPALWPTACGEGTSPGRVTGLGTGDPGVMDGKGSVAVAPEVVSVVGRR